MDFYHPYICAVVVCAIFLEIYIDIWFCVVCHSADDAAVDRDCNEAV